MAHGVAGPWLAQAPPLPAPVYYAPQEEQNARQHAEGGIVSVQQAMDDAMMRRSG